MGTGYIIYPIMLSEEEAKKRLRLVLYMMLRLVRMVHLSTLAYIMDPSPIKKCGIAGENRPTGAKFPMEIIDL